VTDQIDPTVASSARIYDCWLGGKDKLPAAINTHQVAQSAAPDSRVVYVDHEPIVLLHARKLLTSTPEGATAYLNADLRDTRNAIAVPGAC
jgi:hypothetical protein